MACFVSQPPQSVGALADRLLEINVPNEIIPNLRQNISRAARRDAVAVLVRGPATLGRASSPSSQWKHVTIRVGDDAAETHAYVRASRIVKSDGTTWGHEVLREEIKRQLGEATDGTCPECAAQQNS